MPPDPNKTSGQLEFHALLLDEVKKGNAELRREVTESRIETARFMTRLDDHIDTCDKRWEIRQKESSTPLAHPILNAKEESALFTKKRFFRKVLDSMVDKLGIIIIIAVVQMAIFAWQHGFRPSIEGVTPAAAPSPSPSPHPSPEKDHQ